jgi:hypothetical protein
MKGKEKEDPNPEAMPKIEEAIPSPKTVPPGEEAGWSQPYTSWEGGMRESPRSSKPLPGSEI